MLSYLLQDHQWNHIRTERMSVRMQTRSMVVKVEQPSKPLAACEVDKVTRPKQTMKVRRANGKGVKKQITKVKAKIVTKGKSLKEKVVLVKQKRATMLMKELTEKESTKIGSLNFEKSMLLPTEELRGKLEKILGDNENGLKYVTYEELRNNLCLQEDIIKHMKKSKRMVVITGAGISCNAGIPDFRSSEGLYNKSIGILRGKDMFDISIYRNYDSILMFNKFMQDLYLQVKRSEPTFTHQFIKKLSDSNKLIKCYTQNIDGIERKIGLKTEFDCEAWNESKVIQLHGDLHELRCNLCHEKYGWNDFYDDEGNILEAINARNLNDEEQSGSENDDYDSDLMLLSQGSSSSECSEESLFSKARGMQDYNSDIEEIGSVEYGTAIIECPKCIRKYHERVSLGKRSLESSIGIIRPNIVLYGEEHPYSEKFGVNISRDLNKKPNMLIIFGTSLRVTGVKKMVREMSKKVHEAGGIVVLVNREAVSSSCWKNYVDYQIVSDCDGFCELVSEKVFA